MLRVGGVGVDRDGAGTQRLDAARETLGLGLQSAFGLLAQTLVAHAPDAHAQQRVGHVASLGQAKQAGAGAVVRQF